MVESGYVEESYIQGMLDREKSFSVAIGSHVAIPHGTDEARSAIKKTGLVVMTYPEGIAWGDDTVRLVVGIASLGEDHLGILGKNRRGGRDRGGHRRPGGQRQRGPALQAAERPGVMRSKGCASLRRL